MDSFGDVDFMVVPIQEPKKFKKMPNYDGKLLCWGNEATWVSWQEREDFYPNCSDWFVIPPMKRTYNRNGCEIAYFILDIDNHEGDDFKGAVAFIKDLIDKGEIPKTLMVQSASGGLHLYFWTFADSIPHAADARRTNGLPIEIKSSHGWVAPNGRDRKIIRDLPIAPLHVIDGTWFGEFAKIKPKKDHTPRAFINEDFDIDSHPIPDTISGYRHATLNTEMMKLYYSGCPDDMAIEWGYKFYEANDRRPQRNEVENMWRDVKRYCGENDEATIKELLEMSSGPSKIASKPTPPTKMDVLPSENEKPITEPLTSSQDIVQLLNLEQLSPLEEIEAQAVFATEEEKIELRKKYIAIRGY